MINKLLVVLFLIVISFSNFDLDNGVGLKGQQVAGAYTALATGVDALYWNPANLSKPSEASIYVSYEKNDIDIADYAGIWNFSLCEGVGMGVGYYHVGDSVGMFRTTETVTNNSLGTFAYATDVALLGVGWHVGDISSLGLTFRGVKQKAVSENAYFSSDLGLSFDFSDELKLGLVVTDILHNYANRDELKMGYRLGVGYALSDCSIAVDYDYKGSLQKGFYHFGGTIKVMDCLYLKAGYSEYDKLPFTGITLTIDGLELDYLYSNPELGAVHQIGIQVNL